MTDDNENRPDPSDVHIIPTWSAVGSGLTGTKVNSLVIAPKTLYAGTDYKGIFKSYSGGSWVEFNSGLASTIVYSLVAIDPVSQAFYAGTYSGVYKKTTTNNIDYWRSLNNVVIIKPRWSSYSTVHSLTNTMVKSLVIDPNNRKPLYAGTTNWGVYKFYSSIGSWSTVNNGVNDSPKGIPLLTNYTINSLVIDPSNSQTLYAGTYNVGIFRSYSGGHAWRAVNNVSPPLTNYTVYSLVIDPNDSNTIYAGTNYGVIKSTNNGDTWNSCTVNSGLTVYALVVLPTPSTGTIKLTTIYAGTNHGVFKSTYGGRYGSWSPLNNGLPSNTPVLSLAFDNASKTLYAGTYNGGVFSIKP